MRYLLDLTSAERSRRRADAFGPGDVEKARKFLLAAVRRFPRSADLRVRLAESLRTVDPAGSAAELRTALELEPSFGPTVFNSALGLYHAGAVDEARLATDRASSMIGPGDLFYPNLLNLRGMLAAEREDGMAEAEFLLRDAAEREATDGVFWTDLARVIAVRGRRAEALALLDEVENRLVRGYDASRARRYISDNFIDAEHGKRVIPQQCPSSGATRQRPAETSSPPGLSG